ncbi:hypothetical protein BDZ97DRAFT_2061922 [Flammula alnicola]|nr:hypothetical protein BDZ97DRAFT_2061922 [Flammula alnicola]
MHHHVPLGGNARPQANVAIHRGNFKFTEGGLQYVELFVEMIETRNNGPLRPCATSSRQPSATETDVTKVTVVDPENKARGILGYIQARRADGSFAVGAGLVYLQESSTASKLDMLYRKSLYSLALNLAPMQKLDESSVADIYRQYGNHLYGAIGMGSRWGTQLCYTEVSRRTTNKQPRHLQELHSLGLANADHTTLLLNTYTKLKYIARIDSFIKTEITAECQGRWRRLVGAAIRPCHRDSITETRIKTEDAGNFADALTYLRKLGPEAAENNLPRYGRAMLQSLREETMQPVIDPHIDVAFSTESAAPAPSYLSYIALNRGTTAATIVSSETAMPPLPSNKTVRASRRESVHEASVSASGPSTPPPLPTASSIVSRQPPTATLPVPVTPSVKHVSPGIYFLRFADYIGSCKDSVNDQPPGSTGLYNENIKEKEGEGNAVLRSVTIPYDSMHALILCSSYGFTDGLVLLWEKMGMYEDVLRFWMDKDKEGNNPGTSHKVVEQLIFLTSTAELLARHQEDVKGILEYIDEEESMPPLGVIQVLSRNGVASVGLVKEWLVKRIKESRSEIQNDQELTKSYRLETAARLKQVQELTSPDEPRVFHVTRCTTCLGQLDPPSVHFMCNHSYHQRCIAETECPACVREHAVIREIRQTNEKLADQHEVFLSEVQEVALRRLRLRMPPEIVEELCDRLYGANSTPARSSYVQRYRRRTLSRVLGSHTSGYEDRF